MYQSQLFLLNTFLFCLQHLFQLGQTSVLQFRCLIQIIILLGFLDFLVDLLDLLTDFLYPLHRSLFIVPLCFLAGKFFPQLCQFFLKMYQPFLA